MGFLTDLVSATVKTALTPVAIVKDAATVLISEKEPEATKELLESAAKDVEQATDDLADGDML